MFNRFFRWIWNHKRFSFIFFFLVLLTLFVIFGVWKPWIPRLSIEFATNNDNVSGSLDLRNGTYVVYMHDTHDEGYCTQNERIYKLAQLLAEMKLWVTLESKSFLPGDLDGPNALWSGCQIPDPNIEEFRLLSIKLSLHAKHNIQSWERQELEPFADIIDLPPKS